MIETLTSGICIKAKEDAERPKYLADIVKIKTKKESRPLREKVTGSQTGSYEEGKMKMKNAIACLKETKGRRSDSQTGARPGPSCLFRNEKG